MNNIIVVLIISFTKLLSLLPRSFFFVSNSKVWNTLSTPLKKRRKIIEANINYCFDDKPQEWRQAVINKTWDETCLLYTSPSPRDLSTSRMPSSA